MLRGLSLQDCLFPLLLPITTSNKQGFFSSKCYFYRHGTIFEYEWFFLVKFKSKFLLLIGRCKYFHDIVFLCNVICQYLHLVVINRKCFSALFLSGSMPLFVLCSKYPTCLKETAILNNERIFLKVSKDGVWTFVGTLKHTIHFLVIFEPPTKLIGPLKKVSASYRSVTPLTMNLPILFPKSRVHTQFVAMATMLLHNCYTFLFGSTK